jgi:hypothetical protein
MTEPKSQDKLYPLSLKQEPFEPLGWNSMGDDLEDFKNSNSFFMSKHYTKNQFFNDFNPLAITNPELNNDTISIFNPNINPSLMNDPADQSIRNNSSFPLFNERLLVNSNNAPDMNANNMNKHYSLEVMNNMRQVQSFGNPMTSYFPFNVLIFSDEIYFYRAVLEDHFPKSSWTKSLFMSIPSSKLPNKDILNLIDMKES